MAYSAADLCMRRREIYIFPKDIYMFFSEMYISFPWASLGNMHVAQSYTHFALWASGKSFQLLGFYVLHGGLRSDSQCRDAAEQR